ncbi:hypothetical protein NIES208_08285 [[Limnothrix rosea] IAM M-220]|nr:hypothetical protein NIES208_08285 [[Limnothrix rosea] IAM M-220]
MAIAAFGIVLAPNLEASAKGKPDGVGKPKEQKTEHTSNDTATGIQFFDTDTKCDDGSFAGTLIDAGALVCEGVFYGNDSNQINESTELFNLTGWKELTKIDGSSGTNNIVTVSELEDGGYSWAFKETFDLSTISDLFFSVKGGPSFSAYLWDGETTSGTFNTQGIVKGNGKGGPGLSHLSFYYRNETYTNPDTTPVPTPAALLPVLTGVFGMAAKRKQEDPTEDVNG